MNRPKATILRSLLQADAIPVVVVDPSVLHIVLDECLPLTPDSLCAESRRNAEAMAKEMAQNDLALGLHALVLLDCWDDIDPELRMTGVYAWQLAQALLETPDAVV